MTNTKSTQGPNMTARHQRAFEKAASEDKRRQAAYVPLKRRIRQALELGTCECSAAVCEICKSFLVNEAEAALEATEAEFAEILRPRLGHARGFTSQERQEWRKMRQSERDASIARYNARIEQRIAFYGTDIMGHALLNNPGSKR